ncbi:MAG: PAS domain S-box protein [Thermodesulfobacteriota bacterium]
MTVGKESRSVPKEPLDNGLRLREAQVYQVLSLVSAGMWGNAAGAAVLALAMWGAVDTWKLVTWAACLLAIQPPRYVLVNRFLRIQPRGIEAIRWGNWFAYGAAANAIMWGIAPVFLFPSQSLAHQFLLGLFLLGTSCFSAVIYSPMVKCYVPSIIFILGPMGTFYLVQSGEVTSALSVGIFVFGILLVGTITAMHRVNSQTLKLTLDNADLVDTLRKEKHRAEALNAELVAEVQHRRTAEEDLRKIHMELESRVRERTAELQSSNERLRQEMSERQQAEQALKESELRHRLLTQCSLTGIFILQDGVFAYVNDRLAQMCGHAIGDLLGRPFWEFIFPEDREMTRKRVTAQMNGEPIVCQYEFRYLGGDGQSRWAELLATVIQYQGRPAIMGNVADINERKKAQDALTRSEEQYRLVVENASEAILVAQDGLMKFVNPRVEQLTGYSRNELLSTPFLEFIHPADRELVASRHQRRLRNEPAPHKYQFRVVNKSGSIHWVEINAILVEWDGRPATLNFLEDVTARRRMEEELSRVEKLESIGILAGGIAHDFNNILTAILGNISLAKMYLPSNDKVYQRLSEAEKASTNAQSLTQQLLTLAKGRILAKKLSVLSNIVEAACHFSLRGSNVRCEFVWPKALWSVEVDEAQITHVISNLVINAQQAMPSGGVIHVRGENVVVTPELGLPLAPGIYVRLAVKDTGCGIPPEHVQRVFDPYFTTKQKGSGLGLATSYSIVKGHGGLITLESEVGSGTTFYIYLPASERRVNPAGEDRARLPRGEGRILVVDDEAPVRDILGEMLAVLGYEVVFAKEGSEGVELYRKAMESAQKFDAVIMDLTIPGGMGGKDAVRVLQDLDPEVKAIVSSGYATDPILADYKKYGFVDAVPKPYTTEELAAALGRVLAKKGS